MVIHLIGNRFLPDNVSYKMNDCNTVRQDCTSPLTFCLSFSHLFLLLRNCLISLPSEAKSAKRVLDEGHNSSSLVVQLVKVYWIN